MTSNEQIKLRLRRNTFNYSVTSKLLQCTLKVKQNLQNTNHDDANAIDPFGLHRQPIEADHRAPSNANNFKVKYYFSFSFSSCSSSSVPIFPILVHLQMNFCWAVAAAVVVWQGNRKIHNKFSNSECWRRKAHTCMHARDRNNFISPHPPIHPIRSDPCAL